MTPGIIILAWFSGLVALILGISVLWISSVDALIREILSRYSRRFTSQQGRWRTYEWLLVVLIFFLAPGVLLNPRPVPVDLALI
jgi:hypothetical protein